MALLACATVPWHNLVLQSGGVMLTDNVQDESALTDAPERLALVKSAPSKSPLDRSAVLRSVPTNFASLATTPNMDTPLMLEPEKFVCRMTPLVYWSLCRSLFEKSCPEMGMFAPAARPLTVSF